MKKTLLLLLILVYFKISGQVLTNKQVYDFLPGDIFQVEHYDYDIPVTNPCAFPSILTLVTDSIISKRYSALNDTVFYNIRTVTYIPQQCDPRLPPIRNVSTATRYYTHLNDSATHFKTFTCMPVSDTSYHSIAYCGKLVLKRHSNFNIKYCFEEPFWSSTLVEGCGGPYVDFADGTIQYKNTLVYYKKGGISCGKYNTVGINENETTASTYLYPNPNNGLMNFQYSISKEGDLFLYDLSGNLIANYKLKAGLDNQLQIQQQELDNGVYFYKMVVDKEIKAFEKFVIIH